MKRYFLVALVATMAFGMAGCMSSGGTKNESTVGDFGSDVKDGAGNLWDRMTGKRTTIQIPHNATPAQIRQVHSCAARYNRQRSSKEPELVVIEPEDGDNEMKAGAVGVAGVGAAVVAAPVLAVVAVPAVVLFGNQAMQQSRHDSVTAKVYMDQCMRGY